MTCFRASLNVALEWYITFLTKPGVYNLLLLPAALLLLIWSTAANEFELYLWDTFNQRICLKLPSANQHRTHSNINCIFILQLFVTSPSRLLCILSTDFLALRLFCFNISQYGRQILYFKLHVDGRKFRYRRPQVVHRWTKQWCKTLKREARYLWKKMARGDCLVILP